MQVPCKRNHVWRALCGRVRKLRKHVNLPLPLNRRLTVHLLGPPGARRLASCSSLRTLCRPSPRDRDALLVLPAEERTTCAVRLSVDPLVSARRTTAEAASRASPQWSRTRSTTSWSLRTSQTPSQASTKNKSSSRRVWTMSPAHWRGCCALHRHRHHCRRRRRRRRRRQHRRSAGAPYPTRHQVCESMRDMCAGHAAHRSPRPCRARARRAAAVMHLQMPLLATRRHRRAGLAVAHRAYRAGGRR